MSYSGHRRRRHHAQKGNGDGDMPPAAAALHRKPWGRGLHGSARRAGDGGVDRAKGVTFHLSAVTRAIHLPRIGLTTGVTPPSPACFAMPAVTQLARFKTRGPAPTRQKPRFSAIAWRWHGDCSLKPVQAGRGKCQLRRRAEHRDRDYLGDRMATPMGGPGQRRHEARSWQPERSLPPPTVAGR